MSIAGKTPIHKYLTRLKSLVKDANTPAYFLESVDKYSRLFGLGVTFETSLIFVCKAGTYPSGVGHTPTRIYSTRLTCIITNTLAYFSGASVMRTL